MSLNKRILLLLILFNLCINQFNPSNNSYPRRPKKEKMDEIIDDRIHVLNEIRGKTNDIMFESRILKVKIEIYSVFVKILLSVNIVFFIVILSLLSYRVYLYFKGKKMEKIYKMKLADINGNNNLNLDSKKKKENCNNNLESEINNDKQNSLLEQELLNKSGIEAPSVEKYYKNTL